MKEQIKLIVQSVFGVDNFVVPHRKMRERIPRQVYAYLLREHTDMKPPEIAKEIGRDRTCVYASCRVVKDTLMLTAKYREPIEKCIRLIMNHDSRFIFNHFYWLRYLHAEVWSIWHVAKFAGIIDNKYIWHIDIATALSLSAHDFESDGEIKHD